MVTTTAFPRSGPRLLPARFTRRGPVLPLVKLHGTIGMGSPLRPALNLDMVNSSLERAFSYRGVPAVLLAINSPGGSAVQSALIHNRVRQLAERARSRSSASARTWPPPAATGWPPPATRSTPIMPRIVGSIGVLYAGFGFVEALDRLGVERRVHTAGKQQDDARPLPAPARGRRGAAPDDAGRHPRGVQDAGQDPARRQAQGSRTTSCSPAPSGPAGRPGSSAWSTASAACTTW
jgi:hypothetical protein